MTDESSSLLSQVVSWIEDRSWDYFQKGTRQSIRSTSARSFTNSLQVKCPWVNVCKETIPSLGNLWSNEKERIHSAAKSLKEAPLYWDKILLRNNFFSKLDRKPLEKVRRQRFIGFCDWWETVVLVESSAPRIIF